MLAELSCPTCGGPALCEAGEISCPLCGNQSAPEVPSLPNEPEAEPVEIPPVVEFNSVANLSEDEIDQAVEYLIGFVETYEGMPVEMETPPEGEATLTFAPRAEQHGPLSEACRSARITPRELFSLAVFLYSSSKES